MRGRLNDEQRKLVADNHNLIYAFLHSNRLSIEDYYDLAAIGICKAALAYDDTKSKFSTYAYKCMWNQVMIEKRKQNAIMRADEQAVFYYEAMFDCNDESECSFLSLLPDWKQDVGKQAEIRHFIFELYSKLNEKEIKILDLLIQGYTQREICSCVGCAQPTVSRFQKRLKDIYEGKRVLK